MWEGRKQNGGDKGWVDCGRRGRGTVSLAQAPPFGLLGAASGLGVGHE